MVMRMMRMKRRWLQVDPDHNKSADHHPHPHNKSRRFGLYCGSPSSRVALCCCVRPAGSHSPDHHHLLSLNHRGTNLGRGEGERAFPRTESARFVCLVFVFVLIAAGESILLISGVFFAPKLLCNSPPPPAPYCKRRASEGSNGGNIRRRLTL